MLVSIISSNLTIPTGGTTFTDRETDLSPSRLGSPVSPSIEMLSPGITISTFSLKFNITGYVSSSKVELGTVAVEKWSADVHLLLLKERIPLT